VGRQRLPARCRGIHHSWRRGGGPVRRPIFVDCRHRAVCSRLIADRRRPGRDRGHRRACLAGAWRSLRRRGHPCGGVGGGPRFKARAGDQRLDRLPDARLQHWTAGRRSHDALCGMALQLLAQCRRAGPRGADVVAASRERRVDASDGLDRTGPSRGLHGHAGLGPSFPGDSLFHPAGSKLRACVGCVRLCRADPGGATPSSTAAAFFRIGILPSPPGWCFC